MMGTPKTLSSPIYAVGGHTTVVLVLRVLRIKGSHWQLSFLQVQQVAYGVYSTSCVSDGVHQFKLYYACATYV